MLLEDMFQHAVHEKSNKAPSYGFTVDILVLNSFLCGIFAL
jgi:hypothetical protein